MAKPNWWYENATPSRRKLCENDRGPTNPTRRTVEVRCCGSWLLCNAFTVTGAGQTTIRAGTS
jgi:hypothetical protein